MNDLSDRLVLVADDEESVRKLIERILGRKGYKASVHENGLLLVEKFLEIPAQVGLVITDMEMPDIKSPQSGPATINNLREKSYAGNIIGMSGRLSVDKILGYGATHAMTKPFYMDPFLSLVKEAYKN
jgi:DNA-binding NtrC family response regulator